MSEPGRRNKEEEEEMSRPCCLLFLPLGNSSSSFNLEKAVCSHGFFMMAPNLWDPSKNTLQRPLRLSDSTTSVTVRISHPPKHSSLRLQILGIDFISTQDQQLLLAQVARMLRISEEDERKIAEFHKIHPNAEKRGFGRVFRSPTLFEDMVKSILLCNCGWGRSLDMARALCELQLELKDNSVIQCSTPRDFIPKTTRRRKRGSKRKHGCINAEINVECGAQILVSNPQLSELGREYGDFPSSKEIASLDEEFFSKRCKLGYRGSTILKLAKRIESGKLRLERFEEKDEVEDKAYEELMRMKGFGSFACSYVLTCIGFYQRIPADTETIKHLQKFHARKNCTIKSVEKDAKEIYDKYAPFQFLAYWSELWEFYEKEYGKMSELPPASYKIVTINGTKYKR